MSYKMYDVVLGALLHDIGKLAQRAYGFYKNIDWEAYDMESTLCPKNKFQKYTHQHVLFTNAFFDLIKKHMIPLPESLNMDKITYGASFHHKPENAPNPSIAWIIALADRYSAGMDRKSGDEEGEGEHSASSIGKYRRIPLKCIFDEINIDFNRDLVKVNAYDLCELVPYDANALIPHELKSEYSDLPDKYKTMWDSWIADFLKIGKMPQLTDILFEEITLSLLERYTWAIPSSTIDIPDISLYDHSRTTAAISACLYAFHERLGELENTASIKNENQDKFRFISGDLSGLQSTLFTLENQGVKGVSKILRARSFMLGVISEAASLITLEKFGLPLSCIVQQAGGKFLILIPNIKEAPEILSELRASFESWLLENYTGSLSLNMVMSEPFSGFSFKQEGFKKVMDNLRHAINNAKQRPLSTCKHGVLKHDFPYDRTCSVCGVRPAQINSENEFRCVTCQNEFELGKRLTISEFMVWGKGLSLNEKPIKILGLELYLIKGDNVPSLSAKTISFRIMTPEKHQIPWAYRIIANYIPRFESEYDFKDLRYADIANDEFIYFKGMPKTFSQIGADAKEYNENGKYQGKPFLGLLKADVDYLGFIFSHGLLADDVKKDRYTLSRLAQLSRMLDLYFTGFLQGLIHREFPNTYTIYSGGDDLLLIGPWFQMLALAKRMQETFSEYTGKNPNITISAGLSLLHANYPVNRAVQGSEELLKLAKDTDGKNKICALVEAPITWEHYAEALSDADWIHSKMQGMNAVSTGFVYNILSIAKDAEAVEKGDVSKAGWRAKLAYLLARNIKGRTQKDRNQNISDWLERLGLDDLCRLAKKHPNILAWRLPISIALYRSRK